MKATFTTGRGRRRNVEHDIAVDWRLARGKPYLETSCGIVIDSNKITDKLPDTWCRRCDKVKTEEIKWT